VLFNGPDNPEILPLSVEGPRPHLRHGSMGPPESAPRTASRSVQPFLQGSPVCPTDIHTDRQADIATSVAIKPHLCMRPNNDNNDDGDDDDDDDDNNNNNNNNSNNNSEAETDHGQ